jgi:hypothetical protein
MALATTHLSPAWHTPGLSPFVIVGDRVITVESQLPWNHSVPLSYNAARFIGTRSVSRC